NLLRRRAALEVDEDGGHAIAGEAAQEVELGSFLKLALEALGNLLEHVLDAGTGPCGLHHHRLDDERGVFVAAETLIGKQARDNGNDHQVNGQGAVPERPLGKIDSHLTAPTRAVVSFAPDEVPALRP